jgi:four helix bundle protein
MYPFKRLLVWNKAHQLSLALLNDLNSVRNPRLRTVADQAWRAACSVAANIAEGAGYESRAQFARHLSIALGSAQELESHLELLVDARQLTEVDGKARLATIASVRRMIWALRAKIRRNPNDG